MKFRSPIFCPARRCAACIDSDMLSCPPATTIASSPSMMCCAPSATALQPRAADLVDAPGRALLRQPGVDMRLPRRVLPLAGGQHLAEDGLGHLARLDARRGSSTSRITAAPRSCAGVSAKAPLKLPTGVRAAEAITILVIFHPPWRRIGRRRRGSTDESPPGASAGPSSHEVLPMLNRDGPARKSASGRQTWARAALPTTIPTCPVRGPRQRAPGSAAASGRASAGGAMLSVSPQKTSAGAVTRRGSTVAAEEAPAARRRPVADLPADQQVPRRAHRHRHPVGQPVLERDEEPRRRPRRVEPRQLLELQRRLRSG